MESSTGILTYYKDWAVVEIGYEFSNYYRSLLPKYLKVQPSKYPAHITVVRKNLEKATNWGYLDKCQIKFDYEPIIKYDSPYYFIDCWSDQISEIRQYLGLPKYRMYGCYHITIGNTK